MPHGNSVGSTLPPIVEGNVEKFGQQRQKAAGVNVVSDSNGVEVAHRAGLSCASSGCGACLSVEWLDAVWDRSLWE